VLQTEHAAALEAKSREMEEQAAAHAAQLQAKLAELTTLSEAKAGCLLYLRTLPDQRQRGVQPACSAHLAALPSLLPLASLSPSAAVRMLTWRCRRAWRLSWRGARRLWTS
jgi:hypothetical protein